MLTDEALTPSNVMIVQSPPNPKMSKMVCEFLTLKCIELNRSLFPWESQQVEMMRFLYGGKAVKAEC